MSLKSIMISRFDKRKQRAWLLGFIVWTLVALLTAIRNYLTFVQLGYHPSWRISLLSSFVDYYLWAFAAIFIFQLCRRFPLEEPHFVRNAFLHAVFSSVFTFSVALVSVPVFSFLRNPQADIFPAFGEFFESIVFPANLYQGLITFWATVAVAHAVNYYRRSREKEVHLQKLAVQLAEAKLQALRMQIHPHFLFNTLNSITALLHRDTDAAERMIAYLAEFLRLTLNASENDFTALKNEIYFLETYLKIEKLRFRDCLTVKFKIEPSALVARVPTLILQPLVENAIRHGFAHRSANCVLEIAAQRNEDRLLLAVKDNGSGFPAQHRRLDFGVGLMNTSARLAEIYGGDFQFEIKNLNSAASGAVVRIEVPFTDYFDSHPVSERVSRR